MLVGATVTDTMNLAWVGEGDVQAGPMGMEDSQEGTEGTGPQPHAFIRGFKFGL